MIFLITNRKQCKQIDFQKRVREASLAGVDYVLIREKDLDNEELRIIALELEQLSTAKTKIIIGHSKEVFHQIDDVYLHNSFNDINPDTFSVATHNIEEIKAVMNTNISYAFVSHIFKTKCKENQMPKGVKFIEESLEVTSDSKIEIVALGGINRETINVLRETKLKHIAIMSEWLECDNIKKLIQDYRKLGY